MALPFAGLARAEQAWTAELLQGNFDGSAYRAGLHLMLLPGWKTYWRNPGDGGIPPDITLSGDNLASFAVDAPLPIRIEDESGEAIGYHDEVVFPLTLTQKYAAAPLAANLKSFFGVCAKICTPAKFNGDFHFQPSSVPSASSRLLDTWIVRVPQKKNFISAATVKDGQLVLDLTEQVDDIFVEGPDRFYFHKPDLTREATKGFIEIDGLKSDQDLKSASLRITANMQGKGLEQMILLT